MEENSPQEGRLAAGTEEELLLPFSSLGTSCTRSFTALLPPRAPGGRTLGLALLSGVRLAGRREEDTRAATQQKIRLSLGTGDL